ncbi:MAG TPA: glycosyltransferase family 39 protein [Gemmatimonadales bacterium]
MAFGGLLLIVYLSNGRTIWSGDTVGARYLPLSIIREGNFDLDEFRFLYADGIPYYVRFVNGHFVSDYPVGAALLAVPFYVPSALGRVSAHSSVVTELEKLSAATMVAISAAVLYLVARQVVSHRMALLIATIYALGTSSLSVSSQALWQHSASQLALTTSLYCFVRGRKEPLWVALAGLPLAFAVISRPPNALIAVPLAAYVLIYNRRQIWGFVLSGLSPILFQLWYNARMFGNPLRSQFPVLSPEGWTTPLLEGLAGVLLSPSRGLFVYSPIFAFAVIGIGLSWRRNGDIFLRYLSVGAVLTVLLYSKRHEWWAGFTYGPRFLADLTPILALSLYPVRCLLIRSWPVKGAFIVLAILSIGAHSLGAFWDDLSWHVDVDVNRDPAPLWWWTDNQLINSARAVGKRVVGALLALMGVSVSRTGAVGP